MKKRKRMLPCILIALLSIVGFILYINTFDPSVLMVIGSISINPIIPFFAITFLIISCTTAFLLIHSRRGLFVGLLVDP